MKQYVKRREMGNEGSNLLLTNIQIKSLLPVEGAKFKLWACSLIYDYDAFYEVLITFKSTQETNTINKRFDPLILFSIFQLMLRAKQGSATLSFFGSSTF